MNAYDIKVVLRRGETPFDRDRDAILTKRASGGAVREGTKRCRHQTSFIRGSNRPTVLPPYVTVSRRPRTTAVISKRNTRYWAARNILVATLRRGEGHSR